MDSLDDLYFWQIFEVLEVTKKPYLKAVLF